MNRVVVIACALWLAVGCSGIMHFVYYEPHAEGWQLGHPAPGDPDDEVIFHHKDYAISVSAMTLSRNIRSVGPPLLPLVPVNGSNDLVNIIAPDTLNIYIQFFLREPADVDFSRITLTCGDQEISVHSIYKLPYSSLETKKLVGMTQTISGTTESERIHGQFPVYQLMFSYKGAKPDMFSVIISANAIRVDGESVPATVITFKKKSISKYQYFP